MWILGFETFFLVVVLSTLISLWFVFEAAKIKISYIYIYILYMYNTFKLQLPSIFQRKARDTTPTHKGKTGNFFANPSYTHLTNILPCTLQTIQHPFLKYPTFFKGNRKEIILKFSYYQQILPPIFFAPIPHSANGP